MSLANTAACAAPVAGDGNETVGGFLIQLLAFHAIVPGVVVGLIGDEESDSD